MSAFPRLQRLAPSSSVQTADSPCFRFSSLASEPEVVVSEEARAGIEEISGPELVGKIRSFSEETVPRQAPGWPV